MRKIILTGAVLAMLTSAASMVHAQLPAGVEEALAKKVDKKDYDTKIQELEGKVDKVDAYTQKTDNIEKALNEYKTQNEENLKKKIDETQLDQKLDTHRNKILNDVDGKITLAKKDLKADAETKFEAQRQILAPLNTIVIGADGKSGLQKDFGDLKKVVGENENEGLQKDVKENKKLLVGDDGNGGLQKELADIKNIVGEDDKKGLRKHVNDLEAEKESHKTAIKSLNAVVNGDNGNVGLKKSVEDLKKVVGENDTEGLRKSVKENENKINQADNKADSAKAESAAANQLALEVKQKIDAMANGQNDVKKDIAELGGRINVTGAMSAALAGLKPLQYDPMAPTQVMGSVSTYEGQQAYALGLAHFTSEDLMVHGGVSFTNSHKYMANVGVTYKFGHSAEKSMIPMRYQAGPISSIYVMQKENEMMREKMAQQEERIAQLEEMIMNMKK